MLHATIVPPAADNHPPVAATSTGPSPPAIRTNDRPPDASLDAVANRLGPPTPVGCPAGQQPGRARRARPSLPRSQPRRRRVPTTALVLSEDVAPDPPRGRTLWRQPRRRPGRPSGRRHDSPNGPGPRYGGQASVLVHRIDICRASHRAVPRAKPIGHAAERHTSAAGATGGQYTSNDRYAVAAICMLLSGATTTRFRSGCRPCEMLRRIGSQARAGLQAHSTKSYLSWNGFPALKRSSRWRDSSRFSRPVFEINCLRLPFDGFVEPAAFGVPHARFSRSFASCQSDSLQARWPVGRPARHLSPRPWGTSPIARPAIV